jgi:hypothetical protein
MELESFLFSAVLLLSAAAVGVALFKHLGLGSVLGLARGGDRGWPAFSRPLRYDACR